MIMYTSPLSDRAFEYNFPALFIIQVGRRSTQGINQIF